jgi:hypothetical protein
MTLNRVVLPSGFTAVFGRRAPDVSSELPALFFEDYLDKDNLPEIAPAIHYNRADYPDAENPLGNDDVGDCTCAGWFHFLLVWLSQTSGKLGAVQGQDWKALTLALYSRLFGYVPGDPSTDQGGTLEGVLDGVQSDGAFPDGSHKIVGKIKVDGSNENHVKLAIQIFGGVYTGLSLSQSMVDSMSTLANGFLWGANGAAPDAPNPQYGHCVYFPGYNDNEAIVDTWGIIGGFTWSWFTYYFADAQGGEVWVPLSEDWLEATTKKSPSGFNLAQLKADLAALG